MKKQRCDAWMDRGGKALRCELEKGHPGDHEMRDGENTHKQLGHKMKLPEDMPKDPGTIRAYLRGATDYATGLGLDRLAADVGVTARAKGEGDADLASRVRKRLGNP